MKSEIKTETEEDIKLERYLNISKQINRDRFDSVFLDMLEALRPEKPGLKITGRKLEDFIIPNIQAGRSCLVNPSRFDTAVKLIKTLAFDRKKSMLVYCSAFTPVDLVNGLTALMSNIPIKRLLNRFLSKKDIMIIARFCEKLPDVDLQFLGRNTDWPLLKQYFDVIKENELKWDVLLIDDIKSYPADENNGPHNFDPDSTKRALGKLAREYSMAVISVA